jgi:hypothetical protein
MFDREAFENVAADIELWENAALTLPLPEVRAMQAEVQNYLAESLNAFNQACRNYADHDGSDDAFAQTIGEVTRRATAMAIFTLGLSQRTRMVAQQN